MIACRATIRREHRRHEWGWRFLFLLGLAAMHAWQTAPVHAGDCKIANGKVDLNILFLYDETDLDGWKPVFTEGSKLLYNATDGNLQFGKVKFYVACAPAKDKADFWITNDNAGASANLLGCGVAGQHVNLSQTHKLNDAGTHGQLGIAHELGHYIFGLRDEYGGCVVNKATGAKVNPPAGSYMWPNSSVAVAAPTAGERAFFCTVDRDSAAGAGTACIMDGGSTITKVFGRTEFCTSADHLISRDVSAQLTGTAGVGNYAVTNNQECDNAQSCWAMVAAKLGVAAPAPPSTAAPAGFVDPTFELIGAAARFVLCIDHSGSMSSDNKMAGAISAANLFVQQATLRTVVNGTTIPGDEVGVVAFDSSSVEVAPLSELVTQADKDAKKAAISALTPNSATDFSAGLTASLNQLTAKTEAGCIEAVIFMSDGMRNEGGDPSTIVAQLRNRGAVVFTVGFGADADTAELASLANEGGGKFYFAGGGAALANIYAEILATVQGAGILDQAKRTLAEAQNESLPVIVDPATSKVSFQVTGAGFSVVLTLPDGRQATSASQPTGVTYSVEGDVQTFMMDPASAGSWSVSVTRTGAGSAEYSLFVFGDSLTGPHVQISAPGNLDYDLDPNGLIVRVTVTQGPGVTGADVTAQVDRPDGTTTNIRLYDNGDSNEADDQINDGVYSTIFRNFAGAGIYTFNVHVNTTGAKLVFGEDLGPNAPTTGKDAVAATRATTGTTSVEGNAPNTQEAILTMAVSPENAGTVTPAKGANTRVLGETLTVSAQENGGFAFDHWEVSGGAGATDSQAASTTLTLDVAKTVTAVFVTAQLGPPIGGCGVCGAAGAPMTIGMVVSYSCILLIRRRRRTK